MKIGFLGFGEADSSIAQGLDGEGVKELWGYDLLLNVPEKREKMLAKMAERHTTAAKDPAELAKNADIIITAIPSQFSVATCESIVKYLEPQTLYLDVSTASPEDKKKISAMVEAQGAKMVDGAMLGPLLRYKHKVPMLLAGKHAVDVKALMEPFGMVMTVVDGEPGTATSIKFLRSIVAKGLACLLIESIQAAQHYGVEDTIVDSFLESYGPGFIKTVDGYISGTMTHARRREHEMENVVDMLKEAGLPCEYSELTMHKLHDLADRNIPARFPDETVPKDWKSVIAGWGLND